MKSYIFVIASLVIVLIFISCWFFNPFKQEPGNINHYNYEHHEILSKSRYEQMQRKLVNCVKNGDEKGLRFLSAQLDTQLKMEDFLIKYREAEHAKFGMYGVVILPALVSFIISLITLVIAKYQVRKPDDIPKG